MKQVPTLTLDGYISNVDLMISKLFEYFILSEYSQTKLFYTEISSLAYLIRVAGPDKEKLEELVIDTLTTLYGRYWDNITIHASAVDINTSDKKSAYRLNIDIEVIVDGATHTLSKAAEIEDNLLKQIDKKIDYFLGATNV